ncbi:docking protein 1 [Protopterus annectens]|uniref:docking protein 1 n=1 Tax=Protopterus annectens TaxID=7888 RepID=UPI001CFC1073|nr:docking protein 1 [Protopterus annectens]
MEKPIKDGQLYVQQQRFGKKWKKNWFVLYPASQYGIARLEFFDSKDGSSSVEKANTKKLDKKIIRLADCISIVPAVTESCPKENMTAFTIETSEKIYCLAAEQQTSIEWVNKLCETAFSTPGDAKRTNSPDTISQNCPSEASLQMAENSIYFSRDQVNEFWVTVQKTEAAERCNLQGSYFLRADKESLILKDPRNKQVLFTWPYKLLRRYGRDKVMFSFEAGRRCETGAGNFTFETKQGNEIFLIVEAAIREQKAQAEDRESCSSLDSESSALQQIKNAIAESLAASRCTVVNEPISETPSVDGISQDVSSSKPALLNKPSSSNGVIGKWEQSSRSSEEKDAAKLLKVRNLPEPPVSISKSPINPVSPHTPLPKFLKGSSLQEDPSSLYSEPLDARKVPKINIDPLYSDPVDSVTGNILIKGQKIEGKPDRKHPLYSDLYEQIEYDVAKTEINRGVLKGRNPEEHIYDEPESRLLLSGGRPPQPLPASCPLYDEACSTSDAWKKQGIEDEVGHEVPYNPSTDDYSVPSQIKSVETQHVKQKGPKPLPLPKPQGSHLLAKSLEVKEPPERAASKVNFNNCNNSELYSTVIKPGKVPSATISKFKTSSNNGVNDLLKSKTVYEDLGEL